jgi:cobaltochelatase CobN
VGKTCAVFAVWRAKNLRQVLLLAAQLGGIGEGPQLPPQSLPVAGDYALPVPEEGRLGSAVIVFYRSHLLAGDIAPVAQLAHAVAARGLGARALYVSSLKEEAASAFVSERLRMGPDCRAEPYRLLRPPGQGRLAA